MASDYDATTAFLQGLANSAMTSARENASRIHGQTVNVSGLRNPKATPTGLVKPVLGAPPKFSDLFESDSTDPTLRYMDAKADEFANKYFPAINACLKTVPEDWLCAIIGGQKPLGHSQTYFDLVWHSARDRAYRAKTSEQRSLEAAFSARGFSLPPGALVDALTQVEARAADAIQEVNLQAAIKDADIKLDLLKFAESEAIKLKLGFTSALADFYRMWISLPDRDIERARVKAQAQASLYSALSTYYNVEISFEELKLRAKELEANIDLSSDRNQIAAQTGGASGASALGAAVQAFAGIAGEAAQAGGTFSAQIENL
jgi:hypothetical protein